MLRYAQSRAVLGLIACAVLGGVMTEVSLADAQPEANEPSTLSPADRERLSVNMGASQVVTPPWPVTRVSITDPEVADVQVLSPTQILVSGKSIGSTDLILWSEEEDVRHVRISVVADLLFLEDELAHLFPGADLSVRQSRDLVMVEGRLRSAGDAPRLRSVLDSFGVRYVDATTVPGVQQVMIHVRVAEVSRRAVRSLGLNGFIGGTDAFGGVTIGPDDGGPINPINIGAPEGSGVTNIPFSFLSNANVGNSITLFSGFPSADLQLFLEALAENQYVRTLAEPTLVALSGEEASFLAGGEFPIPVVQGSGVGGGSTVTIEYREFGVQLNFKPVVLGEGRIRLNIAPEVSELSDLGSVEIEGFRVPSVLSRRAETTIELNSGETFAMAGLLNQSVAARNSRVPLLGSLPVLGPLFRSVRYSKGETELVVLATATLVEPSALPGDPLMPGDVHAEPNDWEFFVGGRIDGLTPALAPAEAEWLEEMGLDDLKGPGAWATYEQPRAVSQARPAAPTEEDETQ